MSQSITMFSKIKEMLVLCSRGRFEISTAIRIMKFMQFFKNLHSKLPFKEEKLSVSKGL